VGKEAVCFPSVAAGMLGRTNGSSPVVVVGQAVLARSVQRGCYHSVNALE
jgi:hypothetical protein